MLLLLAASHATRGNFQTAFLSRRASRSRREITRDLQSHSTRHLPLDAASHATRLKGNIGCDNRILAA